MVRILSYLDERKNQFWNVIENLYELKLRWILNVDYFPPLVTAFYISNANRWPYCLEIHITLSGETLSGETFVGRNFRHQTKNSSLSPDKKFRSIKVKVSLNEVQVNLRGKEVI